MGWVGEESIPSGNIGGTAEFSWRPWITDRLGRDEVGPCDSAEMCCALGRLGLAGRFWCYCSAGVRAVVRVVPSIVSGRPRPRLREWVR